MPRFAPFRHHFQKKIPREDCQPSENFAGGGLVLRYASAEVVIQTATSAHPGGLVVLHDATWTSVIGV